MKSFILFFLAVLLINLSSIAQETSYSFKESYKVSTPARLSVSTSDGNIEVVPSNSNTIEVTYIVKKNNKVLKINRAELEKELSLEISSDQNSLSILVKHPNEISLPFQDRINVSFKIYTPKETATDLKSSDGNISLAGLVANQTCKTSDGNIRVSDIQGNAKGHTSDGNIEAKGIKGSVDFKTSDGNIRLENIVGEVQSTTSDGNIEITKAKGDISLRTSDGDIAFHDISGSISASTSDGSIRGNLLELHKKLSLKTSDGDIYATVPGDLGLDLNIRGSSVKAPFKNFSGNFDKKHIQGKQNGGGIPVEISSSEGTISLNYQ